MKKVTLGLLALGIILYFVFGGSDEDQEVVEQEPVKETQTVDHYFPEGDKKEKKSAPIRQVGKKAPEKAKEVKALGDEEFNKEKEKVNNKVEAVLDKIEVCRDKVDSIISEQELGELESEMWSKMSNSVDEEGNVKEGAGIDRKQIDMINEKIVSLTSVPWHLDEVTSVTSDLMKDEFAAKDPKWVLETGGKLVPCGIYQTHRLFSLWTDLIGDREKLKNLPPDYVENFTIKYVKGLLKNQLGSSGVSMQMEILVGLAQKGYFDPDLRTRLLQFDENLNQDLESFAISGDSGEASLINAIKRDYRHGETVRRDLLDLLNQYYRD